MRAARVIALAAAVACSIAACGVSSTTVTLEVTTDLPCEALRGVDIAVSTMGVSGERSTRTARCTADASSSRVGSLVIVPRGGEGATIAVRVVAGVDRAIGECTASDRWAGCIVSRRIVRFVPGANVDVSVALRRACTALGCDESSTCVAGECKSAACPPGTSCDEENLGPAPGPAADGGPLEGGPLLPDAEPPHDAGADGDATLPLPDGGALCKPTEKICDNKCVAASDPAYGCLAAGCSPCPDIAIAEYACTSQTCALLHCQPGYKKCGSGCVPADVDHGCAEASCAPCDAIHGTASCSAQGKCAITCASGFKSCGGKCVSVSDPTYGCSATGCSAASCPNPGSGTLACVGTSCVIGSCPPGTKKCNQKCVPTDVQNGCESLTSCSACPTSNVCAGTPSVCTCVPESPATTCAGQSCGTATNNCGKKVTCQDKCQAPDWCNGGNAGPNGCGCTPDPECIGRNCGAYYDNCGRYVSCGSCSWPDFCGGGGSNMCGAPFDGDCGPNWPSMGTFWCDADHLQHQTICNCRPAGYADPTLWARQGEDCYTHYTGQGC